MAKKLMERREKLAFGSLEKQIPEMDWSIGTIGTDVSEKTSHRSHGESSCTQSLAGFNVGPVPKLLIPPLQNKEQEMFLGLDVQMNEMYCNDLQSCLFQRQEIDQFDIYTPHIKIYTPREDGGIVRQRPRTSPWNQHFLAFTAIDYRNVRDHDTRVTRDDRLWTCLNFSWSKWDALLNLPNSYTFVRRSHARGAHCIRRVVTAMHCDSILDGMLILTSSGIFKVEVLFPRISFFLPTCSAEPIPSAAWHSNSCPNLSPHTGRNTCEGMSGICRNAQEWNGRTHF